MVLGQTRTGPLARGIATLRPLPSALMVGLALTQLDDYALVRKAQIGDLQRNQLRAPESNGKAHQQERLVARAGEPAQPPCPMASCWVLSRGATGVRRKGPHYVAIFSNGRAYDDATCTMGICSWAEAGELSRSLPAYDACLTMKPAWQDCGSTESGSRPRPTRGRWRARRTANRCRQAPRLRR